MGVVEGLVVGPMGVKARGKHQLLLEAEGGEHIAETFYDKSGEKDKGLGALGSDEVSP